MTRSTPARGARTTGRPNRPPLRLEELGDRVTPAILFTPAAATPVVTDYGGDVLENAPVHLIFWGSAWDQPGNGPTRDDISRAAGKIVGRDYLGALSQYRPGLGDAHLGATRGGRADIPSEPPSRLTTGDISHLIEDLSDRGKLPDPDDDDSALYVVLTPPGVGWQNSDLRGLHNDARYLDGLFDPPDHVHFAWIGGAATLDELTPILSAQVVAALSDPDVGTGVRATVGGNTELSSGEAAGYTYRADGVLVQSYWSAAARAYVVPTWHYTDPLQTFTAPDRQNLVVSGGTLQVNGDQLVSPDDRVSLGRDGGRVTVWLNEEFAEFEAGRIGWTVVTAGAGADTVVVWGTPAGVPVTVSTGAGVDAVHLGGDGGGFSHLDGLGAMVTVTGGRDGDSLTVHDRGNASATSFVVENSWVTRPGVAISYGGLANLTIEGGSGPFIRYDVLGVPTGTALTVKAGSRNSTVAVGGGNWGDVRGGVTVLGEDGTDTLVIEDNGTVATDDYTLAPGGVVRFAPAVPERIRVVQYDGLEAVTLNAANGGNAISVQGTRAGTPVTVNAGWGRDTITVGEGNLDALPAGVTVRGNGGTDTLEIRDDATAFADGYAVSSSSVVRSTPGAPALTRTITYELIEDLTLRAQRGNNAITILSTPAATPVTIDAGPGSDTLVGPNQPSTWTVIGTDAGAVGNVLFRGAELLTGGSGADTFRFDPTGTVTGGVSGGGGRNVLDYSLSGATAPVVVDLLAGSATRIGGGAAGRATSFHDVFGGAGNDVLSGNGDANILSGGAGDDTLSGGLGNDILIGDLGRDALSGNEGDDILVGGTTAFDTDRGPLGSVLAEWTSARSYTERVLNLRGTGTGPRANGTVFLKSSGAGQTVFTDQYADTLLGGAGTDWFFDTVVDTTDRAAGESRA